MKLLIIEDAYFLADMMKDYFTAKGWEAVTCLRGDSGYEEFRKKEWDAVILDVMLPGMDGFTILKKIRAEGNRTPVLMLTARTELRDKLKGFEAGAEDYLTKPFAIEELEMRLQVLSRKALGKTTDDAGSSTALFSEGTLLYEDLLLNINSHLLSNEQNGKNVQLPLKEFSLMEYLMRNSGLVLSKDQITQSIWGYESDVEYNNAEVYISFLRKKIKFLGSNVQIITIRGAGYALASEA